MNPVNSEQLKTRPPLVFDFDGVICEQTAGDYARAKPYLFAINFINELWEYGYHITIHTARYMLRDPQNAHQRGYEEAKEWLKRYRVKYDELVMEKPSAIMYVDDRGFQLQSSLGFTEWQRLIGELHKREMLWLRHGG